MTARLHEPLIDALAEVISDPDEARLVATRAGFPRKDLPEFKTARLFWNRVVEAVGDGKLDDGVGALAAAAAELYPSNEVFAAYRVGASLDDGTPSGPTARPFGAIDNRGATIGQQVIVQGNANFGAPSTGDAGGAGPTSESDAEHEQGRLPGSRRPWARAREHRRLLMLTLSVSGLAIAVLTVSSGARQAVCHAPGIRSLCPERPTAAEQAAWQEALGMTSGDGLRQYLRTYPRGVYVEEARARLDGCRTEEHEHWKDDIIKYPGSEVEGIKAHPTEQDAQHAARDRAQQVADDTCSSHKQHTDNSSFRLVGALFELVRSDCQPRLDGYACAVYGFPVCKVQRRQLIESEICNDSGS